MASEQDSRSGTRTEPVDETEAPRPTPSLRGRAVRGGAWTIAGQASEQGLRLLSSLVLQFLLLPEAFGLMLPITIFLQGLAMFTDVGLRAAIVQSPHGDEPRFLNTAWTVQVIRGVLLCGACQVLAGPFADLVDKPEIAQFIPFLGLSLLFDGLSSTSLATLQRHLAIKSLVIFQIGTQLAATAFTIAYAFESRSVHALVYGAIFLTCVRMVLSHVVFREHRCRFAWDRLYIYAILGFGGWIFVNTLLGFAADQTEKLVVSKYLEDADAGRYWIALNIAAMPYMLMVQLASSIGFPMIARARDERRDLKDVLAKFKFVMLACGGLLCCGMLATGPTVVEVLYTDQFSAGSALVVPIAAGQWFRVTSLSPAIALFALGKLRWITVATIARIAGFAVFVPIVWSLTGTTYGALVGFALGELVGSLAYAASARINGLGWPAIDFGFTLLVAAFALLGHLAIEAVFAAGSHRIVGILVGGTVVCLPWILLGKRVWQIARGTLVRRDPTG